MLKSYAYPDFCLYSMWRRQLEGLPPNNKSCMMAFVNVNVKMTIVFTSLFFPSISQIYKETPSAATLLLLSSTAALLLFTSSTGGALPIGLLAV